LGKGRFSPGRGVGGKVKVGVRSEELGVDVKVKVGEAVLIGVAVGEKVGV
jgi:hypothetical protein